MKNNNSIFSNATLSVKIQILMVLLAVMAILVSLFIALISEIQEEPQISSEQEKKKLFNMY
jgi:hypothetical protein